MNLRPLHYRHHDSPLGPLLLAGDEEGLRYMHMRGDGLRLPYEDWVHAPEAFDEACRQLDAYFAGRLTRFELRLAPRGTEFQRQVWQALCEIPYGATESYAGLAARIGRPSAMRAVGAANGANPIGIIVPCHRVIGRDGSLTGYAGGLAAKEYLLRLEGWQGVEQGRLFA
ncbi:MAG: methylated-DNA--[protein]-cysteine S-methyltransferase [Gammaproteobacteria bacterium]|nr:methylated-DNA--[protein]-cysteine S-methyltransferase [Gammaproteobacteria bacterium]